MDLLHNCRVGRSWHAANFCNINLTFISYSFWNIRRKVLLFFLNWWKKGKNSKMGNQIYFKIAGKKKMDRRVEPPDTFLEENHPMTISSKFSSYWAKWFQTRRFLWEFPIGSYVKLSSAVVAILVVFWNAKHNFGREPLKNHFSKFFLICIIGQNR